MKIKQVEGTTNLADMLKHLAKDQAMLNAEVVSHAGGELTFKVDNTIQLTANVDSKKGMKKGDRFQISMEDLSILVDGKAVELPTSAVAAAPTTRGCSARDKAELLAMKG